MWARPRETSEATESRSGVPQDSFAVEDKAACAELGAGRADGAITMMNPNDMAKEIMTALVE